MTELRIENEDREFQGWMADQDLDDKEKILWNFHRWMRQETDLESGTIVDYRKYMADWLDEDGKLILNENDKPGLTTHKQAAVNKFREFRDNAKIDAKAESQ